MARSAYSTRENVAGIALTGAKVGHPGHALQEPGRAGPTTDFLGASSSGPRRLKSVASRSVLLVMKRCSSVALLKVVIQTTQLANRLTFAHRYRQLRRQQSRLPQREIETLPSHRVQRVRRIPHQKKS